MLKNKNQYILSIVLILSVTLSSMALAIAPATIIYQNDTQNTFYSDSVLINADDDVSDNFGLQFGNTLNETLNWSNTNSRFEFTDDLYVGGTLEVSGNIDLNSNQMLEARLENLSSSPTCNSGAAGRVIFNTTNSLFTYCNGTIWINLSPLMIGQFYDSSGGVDLDVASAVAIPFNQETRKDAGITHSNVTNKSRVTLDTPGWYRVSYSITHANGTLTTGNVHCNLRLDGTTSVLPSDSYMVDTTAFTSKATNSGTAIFQTTSNNQYYEVMCSNNGLSILGSLNTSANESWTLVERL